VCVCVCVCVCVLPFTIAGIEACTLVKYIYKQVRHMLGRICFSDLFIHVEIVPSVLCRCWLGGREGIQPVKKLWWGTGMVICLERDVDLHMAQLMPLLLTVSCFSKIQIGFTFLVPAHLGSPGNGPLNGCVCVCYPC